MTMMSPSLLDRDFVRLGCAAERIASLRADTTREDVMDAFKRGIFSGELDPPPFEDDEAREQASKWLHMEMTVPPCALPPSLAQSSIRPKALYAVGRSTIARVMMCENGLPGHRADWKRLFDYADPEHDRELAYRNLVAIPFREFPELGRRELEALLAPKAMLCAWLDARGLPVEPIAPAAQPIQAATIDAEREKRAQGRPHKSAWPQLVELVHALKRANPQWQKKQLAFEARRLAARAFADRDLPSLATIQRSMVEILKTKPGGLLH